MHRIFKKDAILTIPNLLSIIRLLMIPFIVWTYCGLKQYYVTTILIVFSGVTDVIDGFIARKFNMVSDFGKVLDPIADKFTQAAVIICLATKYPTVWAVVALFLVKECIMIAWGFHSLRKLDLVNSARWYGKVNTVILYTVMSALILFNGISQTVANVLICICTISLILSLILYGRFYMQLFKEKNKK